MRPVWLPPLAMCGCLFLATGGLGPPAAGNVLIDPDPLSLIQNETSLTLVPQHPGIVAVAYNNDPTGTTGLGFGLSLDNGATWANTYLPIPLNLPGGLMANAFDPAAAADTQGNILVAHISWAGAVGSATGLYVHSYKVMGGIWAGPFTVRWDPPALLPVDPTYRLNDKCHLAVDRNPVGMSPFQDQAYVTWIKDRGFNQPLPWSDIYFASSPPGAAGSIWSPEVVVNDGLMGGQSNMGNGPNATVAVDGTVYVAWIDIDVTLPQANGMLFLDRSFDGGMTFGPDIPVLPITACPTHLRTANGTQDARARSFPCIGTNPYNPKHVYMVFAADMHPGNSDEGDIWFVRSLDGGQSWSPPMRVNDDLTQTDQFEPWLAVKPDGTIDVAWYDRRLDPQRDAAWDVYMAKSINGGQSFGPNIRVTNISFPTPVMPWGEAWMGEYLGLAVDAHLAYVAWTSSITDILGDVYFNRVPNEQIPGGFPPPHIIGVRPPMLTVQHFAVPAMDLVQVAFDRPVVASAADFDVRGMVNGPRNDFTLSYDAAAWIATLRWANELADDTYILTVKDTVTTPMGSKLDGEISMYAPMLPSGEGNPGGDFVGLLYRLVGDIDHDMCVNIFDIFAIAEAWNTSVGDPLYNPACDLDGDGSINVFDIFVIAEHWNVCIPTGP